MPPTQSNNKVQTHSGMVKCLATEHRKTETVTTLHAPSNHPKQDRDGFFITSTRERSNQAARSGTSPGPRSPDDPVKPTTLQNTKYDNPQLQAIFGAGFYQREVLV